MQIFICKTGETFHLDSIIANFINIGTFIHSKVIFIRSDKVDSGNCWMEVSVCIFDTLWSERNYELSQNRFLRVLTNYLSDTNIESIKIIF